MVHEQLDIAKFKSLFPLLKLRRRAREFVLDRQKRTPNAYADAAAMEKHIRLMEPHGEIINGSYHIAVVEQLRDEAFNGSESARVSTDVFIFARGEPLNPRCTK